MAFVDEGVAEIVVGLGEMGIERDGAAIGGDSVGETAGCKKGDAEVGVGFGEVGIGGEGSADQIDGDVVAPGLMGDDAQEMECVGVGGLLGEDLAVEVFGFGEAAGLVVLEGEVEGLLEGERGHGRSYLVATDILYRIVNELRGRTKELNRGLRG